LSSATEARRAVFALSQVRTEADRRAREGWLVEAIEELPEDDLAAVERSVEILHRIADADVWARRRSALRPAARVPGVDGR